MVAQLSALLLRNGLHQADALADVLAGYIFLIGTSDR